MIAGDADKLDLVLGNLLANAVKFTDSGGSVEVRILREEEWLSVGVKDTGIGIPDDHLDRVFDRFAQVDSGPTRRFEGAGIGLALVKEIVTLHAARSWSPAASALAASSRAATLLAAADLRRRQERRQVDLPTGERRRADDATPSAGSLHDGRRGLGERRARRLSVGAAWAPLRVLVVEDNPDMRSYLQRRLVEYFQVSACVKGERRWTGLSPRRPNHRLPT